MRLLGGSAEVIPAPTRLSLEELFQEASHLGKLTTGGTFMGVNGAELSCSFVGDDYVSIKSKNLPTLKENIAAVIYKARQLKQLYQQF